MLAVHPCGMAMDMMRVGYRTRMQTWQSGLPAVPVVWFRVREPFGVFPGLSPMRSRNWDDPRGNTGIGEQRLSRDEEKCNPPQTYRGGPPANYVGSNFCGDLTTWEVGGIPGVTPAIITDDDGSSPCCAVPSMVGRGGCAEGNAGTDQALLLGELLLYLRGSFDGLVVNPPAGDLAGEVLVELDGSFDGLVVNPGSGGLAGEVLVELDGSFDGLVVNPGSGDFDGASIAVELDGSFDGVVIAPVTGDIAGGIVIDLGGEFGGTVT